VHCFPAWFLPRVSPKMISRRSARGALLRSTLLVSGLFAVTACSTLPVTGPTGRDIRHAARLAASEAPGQLPFRIVEIADSASVPPPADVPSSTLIPVPPAPTDLIGPGDVVDITIYEAGISLFGRGATRISAGSAAATIPSADQGAAAERLPGVRVDDQGFIRLPFIGRLRAAGHTTSELQSMIREGLRGMSQDPQVMVSMDQSITNSVVLAGEVNRPGRFVLPTNNETLNQTIALAGGYKGEAKDVVARVQRGGNSYEIRLSDLLDLPQRDVAIAPGDTITLVSHPESFSSLGAPNRAEEIRFPRGRISVAEAVALAGGANASAGDAAAIFVFRYVPTANGTEEPVVYHINMMKAGALFLSQRFMMKDKDLLYVGNAEANQPTKFVQLLSQLFIPVATVRTTVQ
jgi:polysaccharide biosynthesis/export protein